MKKISLFIGILAVLSLHSFASKEHHLSYKLEKGKKHQLEISNKQTISMSMMGQQMTLNQNSILNQEVVIADVADDSYTMEMSFKRVQFTQNAMGMEMKWDSDNPSTDNPMSQQLGEALGKSIGTAITTVIDRRGMPISTNKSEVMANNTVSGFESGMMVVYADKAVKVGDSWEVSLQPDPSSDFVIQSTYTLDAIKGKTATISYSGNITGTQVMGEKANVSGSISGKFQVETATGWVQSASVNQTLEMEMEQDGMKIPMKINSFMEITSK